MAAAVEIGFADLLDVLTVMFGIPDAGRKALTSRLKHLQGKSFPPGVNVGRGGRVRYDAEAVMGTILVLTLTSAFIPPNQAVEVVRGHWDEWRDLLRGSARLHLDTTRWNQPPQELLAVITSNALSDLGGATPSEGRAAGLRGGLTFRTVERTSITAGEGAGGGAVTLVDVPGIVSRAADPIAKAAICDRLDVFKALALP